MTAQSRFLYVEDSEADALMLKHLFSRHSKAAHISIETVESVADAINTFDSDQHAAVLIDWILPDGSGADVSDHVRGKTQTTPMIFLSGVRSEAAIKTAKTFPLCSFLKKGHSIGYVDEILLQLDNQGSAD